MDSEARNFLERIVLDTSVDPTNLPISLLKSITDNFSDQKKIGHGGFAVVYKGTLQNGAVAVKKLTQTSIDVDDMKFHQEVDSMQRVKHKNIVRFLGYCHDTQGIMKTFEGRNVLAEERQRFLCFEFVPLGSLDKYISDASGGLEWRTRYQIIKGICEGLHYLHEKRIVHRDLKPANILLDQWMVPKIADFGISKCFDKEQSRVSTVNLCGSGGYIAPESYGGVVYLKSDIYSLGIVIIEILTGEKGCPEKIDNVLETWSIRFQTSREDTRLEPILVCAEIAMECTDFNPTRRPDIQCILERLDEMERNYDVNIDAALSTSLEKEASSSVSFMVDELQPLFASDAPFPLRRITSWAPMGLGVMTSTEILDVHPLELRFPWEPNKDIICPLTLTNWTHHHVGVWITPICPHTWVNLCQPISNPFMSLNELGAGSSIFKMLEPRSTLAIPITTGDAWKELPPRENVGTFEVLMVVAGSKMVVDLLEQSIGKRVKSDVDLLKRVEALGGVVHQALLKATICDPASCPAAVTQRFISALSSLEFGNSIQGIDVHPVEPWVLVTAMNIIQGVVLTGMNVYIFNYLTEEILTELHFTSPISISIAKFIPQVQRFVTGDSDGYVTMYAYSTTDLKHKVLNKFSPHHGKRVDALAVHPTYTVLLTGSSDDNWIRLWDWSQGWKCTRIIEQLVPPSFFMIWNPLDTDTFACISKTCIKVWRVSLSKKASMILSDPSTTLDVRSKSCCFGGDSHRNSMITCPEWFNPVKCVHIWDIAAQKSIHKVSVSSVVDTSGAAWHPTLPIFATSHYCRDTVCLWDARTYRLEKMIEITGVPRGRMVFIGTTNNISRLLVGSEKGMTIIEIKLPTLQTDV